MKLRYWYKTDHNKQPIAGSNIRRKSRPGSTHQWKEILDPCCSPSDVDCTCGPRFFVQLDNKGKPVDGSLIKRWVFPRMEEGIKYYEVPWKSPCCAVITWSFSITDSTGSFVIEVNGNEVVNDIIGGVNSNGSFKPNFGDTISITITNTGDEPITNLLNITGGLTYSDTDTPNITHSFIWNGKDTDISGTITGTIE